MSSSDRGSTASAGRRPLGELLSVDDPAWPLVREWLAQASNPVEVLPPSALERGEALTETQVTLRSPIGAVVYETGGLLIDHGWLRVLGSGHPRLRRTLPRWNQCRSYDARGRSKGFYLIADDVLGGFFAMDSGGLGPGGGQVYYFAADVLAWEAMELTYGGFLNWCLTGDLARYYGEYRWPGWHAEVASLSGDSALSVYPPLSEEGPPIAERSRGPVPVEELFTFHLGTRADEAEG